MMFMLTGLLRGDALGWLLNPPHDICLLPFAMEDGLLPGETLQIHLHEPHQLALFETIRDSTSHHHGCIGQLLESSSDDDGFCTTAPLLELCEQRTHKDIGVWCEFACVGAAAVSEIELRTIDEEMALNGVPLTSPGSLPFLVGRASILRDDPPESEEQQEQGKRFVDSVRELHACVNGLRREALGLNPDGPLSASDRVTSGGDRLGPPPPADSRVEYGHRLGPLIGPYLTIDEHVALRAATLRARGCDEPPDADLCRRRDLWGCANEEAALRRLLSFVACEGLSDEARVGAMALEDTNQRLEHAIAALSTRKAKLTAEVALRRAYTEDGR